MVVEIYLGKLLLFSLMALILGYVATYQTITRGSHDNGGNNFDIFYIFKIFKKKK